MLSWSAIYLAYRWIQFKFWAYLLSNCTVWPILCKYCIKILYYKYLSLRQIIKFSNCYKRDGIQCKRYFWKDSNSNKNNACLWVIKNAKIWHACVEKIVPYSVKWIMVYDLNQSYNLIRKRHYWGSKIGCSHPFICWMHIKCCTVGVFEWTIHISSARSICPTLDVNVASSTESQIPGGYSTLSWVRMCGPKFRPPPYN